jgi:hypothetical protein
MGKKKLNIEIKDDKRTTNKETNKLLIKTSSTVQKQVEEELKKRS